MDAITFCVARPDVQHPGYMPGTTVRLVLNFKSSQSLECILCSFCTCQTLCDQHARSASHVCKPRTRLPPVSALVLVSDRPSSNAEMVVAHPNHSRLLPVTWALDGFECRCVDPALLWPRGMPARHCYHLPELERRERCRVMSGVTHRGQSNVGADASATTMTMLVSIS